MSVTAAKVTSVGDEQRKQPEISNRLLASALEQVNNAVIFVDKDDIISYWNKRAEELYQWTKEEAIGRKVYETTVPQISKDQAVEIMKSIRETGQWGGEFPVKRKDGSTFDAYVWDTLIKDAKGDAVGIVGISIDITERKRADAALQEANKKLSLLSSITRHDIKNQLMVLDGNLTLLGKKDQDDASKELLRKLEIAVNRIMTMVQFTEEYENIGVNAPAWQNVRALVENEAKGVAIGQIKLVNDIPADIEMFADPLIAKVFHNLIDNAVRHGGRIDTIRFFVEEHDGTRAIICEDNGIGISLDKKKELFTRCSEGDHGFGLFLSGEILAITRMSIEEVGEPGKGVKFIIKAPEDGLRMNNGKSISD